MTLEYILEEISKVALNDELVNYSCAGGSIYELNHSTIKAYPLFYTSPTGQHKYERNTTTYALTLFYIDRLLEDSSNDVQIHSTAIESLKEIIKRIKEIDGVISVSNEVTIQLFTETERMADRCSGAYANINVRVKNDNIC